MNWAAYVSRRGKYLLSVIASRQPVMCAKRPFQWPLREISIKCLLNIDYITKILRYDMAWYCRSHLRYSQNRGVFTRVGTLIVATIYLQLLQNRYIFRSHKGLSPCDFHLIPKMKEPLRGIRFRTDPEILQEVERSIRTINTTGAAKGILRLPQRWQRVVHNAGDYIEGQ